MPILPANAEDIPPIINEIASFPPFSRNKYIINATTTIKTAKTSYSFFKKVKAPLCIASEISFIFSLPGDFFIIIKTRIRAKNKEMILIPKIIFSIKNTSFCLL